MIRGLQKIIERNKNQIRKEKEIIIKILVVYGLKG